MWRKIIKIKFHPALLLGITLTLILTYTTIEFYNYRDNTSENAKTWFAIDALDLIDLKMSDYRMKFRGEKEVTAPVALVAIDDKSVEEIGRWPWDRSIMADLLTSIAESGAKAVGLDIIFSEPQISNHNPDEKLKQVIEKYQDKIVLGVIGEQSSSDFLPYQDYCLNENFFLSNGTEIVKLNPNLIVNDSDNPFEIIEFTTLFQPIFNLIEKKTISKFLADRKKENIESLTTREKNLLRNSVADAKLVYCQSWLKPNDPVTFENKEQIFPVIQQLFGTQEPVEQIIQNLKAKTIAHPIQQYLSWISNISLIQNASTYSGSFNAIQDTDGTIRKGFSLLRTGNKSGLSFIPSLAIQTYLVATGHQLRFEVSRDPKNPNQKKISSLSVITQDGETEKLIAQLPVDGKGLLKINYYGAEKSIPYIPAKELLSDSEEISIEQRKYDSESKSYKAYSFKVNKKEFLKDKSLIMGATAIGIYDLRVTPFEKNYPGPETHASLLANLLENNFIQLVPNEFKWMPWLILGLGLLFSYLFAYLGASMSTLVFLGGISFTLFADFWLYNFKRMTFSSIHILALLVLQFALTNIYKYFTEERRKKYIRSTFSKFVSPAIVDEILKDPDNIQLGGKKQNMSVFFSDVRGFTTISEKLDPQQLSDVLNKYLTPMTQIVFDNKGTLDKYMGDAIMAFFGAPIFYSDHAAYACRCALKSLEKLEQLKNEFKAAGLPEIDIGIGVNTGDMSVGNMGSDIVRNYTVMGDAVNLASRLEGINKEYGTRIIISEFTWHEIKDSFTTREVDIVKVKGKNKPVHIYELICEGKANDNLQDKLKKYESAYSLYHQKNFGEALTIFKELASTSDPVAEVYIERCEDYINSPPPAEWDGVYVMKTK